MAELRIDGLGKSFGYVRALDDVSIVATEGQLLTLLGPSGCGKSTTLWAVAGLHAPDTGTIAIGDQVMFDGVHKVNVPPEERDCGVVFQSYAIWPHMRVADNIAYPLKLRKMPKAQRLARVEEMLELVELSSFGDRYPHELSGGQQQRVALARALAVQPRLLLLDEPFSNLDAKLRERARSWLRDLQQRVGITTVFVTHDQDEALSMSDSIVVMNHGRVAQVGTPEEIYRQPADAFVADFVGSINLVPGEIIALNGDMAEFIADGTSTPIQIRVDGQVDVGEAELAIRPEAFSITTGSAAASLASAPVTPLERRFLGDHYRHTVSLGNTQVCVQSAEEVIPAHPLLAFPESCRVFPRRAVNSETGDNNAHPTTEETS
jgi:iron(III) transport system ATP-binding protein